MWACERFAQGKRKRVGNPGASQSGQEKAGEAGEAGDTWSVIREQLREWHS